MSSCSDNANFPYLTEVAGSGIKALDWAVANKDEVEATLREQGAMLIRGLKINSSKQFSQLLKTLFDGELLQYTYRSTPRTEFKGNVYTATEYHADQEIAQHNENAYANRWPLRLGFFCMLPAQTGGQTPIADSREIYRQIPKDIREEFERKGVKYIRNYSEIDLPWSEVFGTEDKQQVEQFCHDNRLTVQWTDNNGLRTTQVNPATQLHPHQQVKVWFNQAHLFHVSNLNPELAANLISTLGEENLPRNTTFGDDSPIDNDYLRIIREIYQQQKIAFDWQKSDVMLLDNMLFTHGRETYTGPRKILVGMARPYGD